MRNLKGRLRCWLLICLGLLGFTEAPAALLNPNAEIAQHQLLFRLPVKEYVGFDGGPIMVQTGSQALGTIAMALAGAYAFPQPLGVEASPDIRSHRSPLTEIHVMVPDSMTEQEIQFFLSSVAKSFEKEALNKVQLTPIVIPVLEMQEASEKVFEELQSSAENRAIAQVLQSQLQRLKTWAQRVKHWQSLSTLEKRNFILVALGLGKGIIGGMILFMDAGADTVNLLRMAFIFSLDIYFMVGHKHYVNLIKTFNPPLLGRKVQAWLESYPQLRAFIMSYGVAMGIQLGSALAGFVAKGGEEAGLKNPLERDELSELGIKTGRNILLEAPAYLSFDLLRSKGYLKAWREDVVNLFVQLVGQSENLAFGTGRKDLWRTFNVTRTLTYLFLAILGRVLPPLKATPILVHGSLGAREIDSIKYKAGIYNPHSVYPEESPADFQKQFSELGGQRNSFQCIKLLSI